MGRGDDKLTGVLNCDKPRGWSSFDVIRKLRRALGVKRMGHTGSLDPIATGVLVVCVGRATRLVELLMAAEKEYLARLRFGAATDTYDSEGEVVFQGQVPTDLRASLGAVLPRYRGLIMQSPPPYSAAKKDGTPLYKLARRGEIVELPPREVEVRELELTAVEDGEALLHVVCGKGTYVRALAEDIGRDLGCGAHLIDLVRSRNGVFNVRDALKIDREPAELRAAALEQLTPPEQSLAYLPSTDLLPNEVQPYLNGLAVTLSEKRPVGSLLRVFGPDGFIGVGRVEPGRGGAAVQPMITLRRTG